MFSSKANNILLQLSVKPATEDQEAYQDFYLDSNLRSVIDKIKFIDTRGKYRDRVELLVHLVDKVEYFNHIMRLMGREDNSNLSEYTPEEEL